MTRNGAARQEDVFVDARSSAPEARSKLLADEEDVAKAFQDKLGMGDLALSRDDGHEEDTKGDGGYRFDTAQHKEEIKRQRVEMWNWLKQIGANLLKEGINLTKISLPVCLFEPRSFLERATSNWDFMDLLIRAAESQDPAERMKYVIGFAVAGLSRQVSFHKPFNPILGETYQAQYPSGIEVYCEQISHHPPVSCWQVFEPSGKFQLYGSGNWSASIKGNSARAWQTGLNTVQFKDGTKITYDLPGILVRGVLWGQRSIKYQGEMKFRDEKNDLSCDVVVDPQPNQGWVSSWFRSKKAAGYKPDMVRGELKKGSTVIDTVTGNWMHSVEWEKGVKGLGQSMWDAKRSQPVRAQPIPEPLPSDCCFRDDLLHLKAGDMSKAQEWKFKLEEVQRTDRRLRKEGGGYEH